MLQWVSGFQRSAHGIPENRQNSELWTSPDSSESRLGRQQRCVTLGLHPLCPKSPFLAGIELAIDAESAALLAQWQAGDEDAATEIFDRYVRRLTGLARSHMSEKLQRRLDADDVIQSVFRSFFDKSDRYVHRRAGDLWRLLASITVNKVRTQAQFHQAGKRAMDADQSIFVGNTETAVPLQLVAHEPSPAEIVIAVEEMELVMGALEPYQRTIFEERLQGTSIEEIAEKTQRSERTVRRCLQYVRADLEKRLDSVNET